MSVAKRERTGWYRIPQFFWFVCLASPFFSAFPSFPDNSQHFYSLPFFFSLSSSTADSKEDSDEEEGGRGKNFEV